MIRFFYTDEFAVRIEDILKIAPAKNGGTYVYVRSHNTAGNSVDREYTKTEYVKITKCIQQILSLTTDH